MKKRVYYKKEIVTGVLFLAGIYLLSPNITGNAVGTLGLTTSSLIGALFIGLSVFGYYFISKLVGN